MDGCFIVKFLLNIITKVHTLSHMCLDDELSGKTKEQRFTTGAVGLKVCCFVNNLVLYRNDRKTFEFLGK